MPTNGQSFKLVRWSAGKSLATARRISVVVAVARAFPPFMKARKASVFSGEAMAWSVSSFLRVLVLDKGRGGAGPCFWVVVVVVGVGGYDGNQTSRSSCQRKFGGVVTRL